MKPIKFRAWDIERKNYWSDGFSVDCDGIGIYDSNEKHFNNNEVIVEQYTGLKDKNGKEIYEGDILKAEYTKTLKVASWHNKRGAFIGVNGFNELLCSDLLLFEIIGNIYENPKLLKEVI